MLGFFCSSLCFISVFGFIDKPINLRDIFLRYSNIKNRKKEELFQLQIQYKHYSDSCRNIVLLHDLKLPISFDCDLIFHHYTNIWTKNLHKVDLN